MANAITRASHRGRMIVASKSPVHLMILDEFAQEYIELMSMRAGFAPAVCSALSYSDPVDGVAVLPITGSLVEGSGAIWRKYGFDVTGYGEIRDAISRMAQDRKVTAIVLDINSPGGSALGVHKTAMAIAKVGKPVTAAISGYGASAAYYLASQAGEIIAEQDAIVGSIGTKSVIYDYSKMFENDGVKTHVFATGSLKATGTLGATVTEEQATAWQRMVDELGAQFFEVVEAARGARGIDMEQIKTGDVWTGARAAEIGLVDSVMSMGEWFETRQQKRVMAEMEKSEMDAAIAAARAEAMAESTARLNAIMAAFPADAEFAMKMYQAGKSVVEAKAEYADVLAAKAETAEAENAALRAQVEALQSHHGAQGVETDGKPVETEKLDYLAMARKRVEQTGCKLTDAYSWVSKNHPDVYAEYLRRDV